MKRRSFLAAMLSVPLLGSATARALGETRTAAVRTAAHVHAATSDEAMATTLWSYMDHASSWDEATADLRRYVADGHIDSALFGDIATLIERELAGTDASGLESVLGFYPGVVLMLHGLRSIGEYGDRETYAAQAAFIQRLVDAR
jgi:hypothetical protein